MKAAGCFVAKANLECICLRGLVGVKPCSDYNVTGSGKPRFFQCCYFHFAPGGCGQIDVKELLKCDV